MFNVTCVKVCQPKAMTMRQVRLTLLVIGVFGLLSACAAPKLPTPVPPALDKELVIYYWQDYFPQSVLDAFTKEYGVQVNYVAYDSYEEASENIRAGKVYDVLITSPEEIPGLIAQGALSQINYVTVPNFKNVSPNFRDLSFDPGNRYSIPFIWGTTGLLVRTDLVKKPVAHWADLWNPEFAGKVGIWTLPRSLIPIALKTLGYPANSENPQHLEQALQRLLELKKNAVLIPNQDPTVVPTFESSKIVIAYGWAGDLLAAQTKQLPLRYILPQEGTILWSESVIIPAKSQHKHTAEVFLNFVLRPDISAQISEAMGYSLPNDASLGLISPEIRKNPIFFPPLDSLKNAEIVLPLSPAGRKLYDDIWQRFMDASE